jgi:hypothetical protein
MGSGTEEQVGSALDGAKRREFEIFVGDVKEDWDKDMVLAGDIMKRAGFSDPQNYVLEALNQKKGNPVAEFQSSATVNLAEPDRKFFRVTPGGGGRS